MSNLDLFFNNLYIVEQEFSIIPKNNSHKGIAIKFLDLQERKQEFINELIDNVISWVYGEEKIKKMQEDLKKEGRDEMNIFSEIRRKAFKKFRKSNSSDEYIINGQFGELMLFLVIKYFFEAEPILRKMPITTSQGTERFGADAIHLKILSDKIIMYLGEAKTYESKYKFNTAFDKAIMSILDTYNNYRQELDFYMYEDFIEEKYKEIASDIKNGTLKNNIQIQLINIIIYNENEKLIVDPEKGENYIKEQIEQIIKERFESYDYSQINFVDNPILYRINYIIFPVWKLDDLLNLFKDEL